MEPSRKLRQLLVLAGSSMLAISHASAALVSVDLNSGGAQSTVANPTFGVWSEGTNYWNTVGVSPATPLVDSGNTATSITFAITNSGGTAANWTTLTNNALVVDGFYRRQDAGTTILTTTISGLQLNTNYELLVYHADDFTYASETATVNGISGSDFTGALGSTGYTDAFDGMAGSDFWYFNSVNSGGSGVLKILSSGNDVSTGYNTISGFQLRAIPEPSAALLGGIGLLALLRRRR